MLTVEDEKSTQHIHEHDSYDNITLKRRTSI